MSFCIANLRFSILSYLDFVRPPALKKCQVFSKNLVDPILKETYKMLPKLPRYGLRVAIRILLIISFLEWRISLTPGVRAASKAVLCYLTSSLCTSRPI